MMFCKKCKVVYHFKEKFCTSCGTVLEKVKTINGVELEFSLDILFE